MTDDSDQSFVGRVKERALLGEALSLAAGGRRQLVLLGGVAGVGKSRLSEYLIHTGRWAMLKAVFPNRRGGHGCAVEADGTILVIGGATPSGTSLAFLHDVEALPLKPKDLG